MIAESYPVALPSAIAAFVCRFCGHGSAHTFIDLGLSPLCEDFQTREQLQRGEMFYPLHALVCDRCLLVQLQEFVSPAEIFSEYAYFSSYSDSWLEHGRRYTSMMMERFGLGAHAQVVELASNDGYLLQHFAARGVPVLGVEPAANVAAAAIASGIPSVVRFFGRETARDLVADGHCADLLIGNNVLAHVPDLNDFVAGMQMLLKPQGIITMEFPHLHRLIMENQFDTIYHEHFSYFSFLVVEQVFRAHGLTIFDVEELPTHGGSLRIYARHAASESYPVGERVPALRSFEQRHGYDHLSTYLGFTAQVEATKRALLTFLIEARNAGKTVVGYGAPGKGNTLLNYCGIRTDLLQYTVDRNPYKHGRFCPGTHIPIRPPEAIAETQPDYVLILPWNLQTEIAAQLHCIRAWGGRCVVPIPTATVLA